MISVAAEVFIYVPPKFSGQSDSCLSVWWSSAHTYKNAITNELFLLTSASGFLRTNNQEYLTNAKKVAA